MIVNFTISTFFVMILSSAFIIFFFFFFNDTATTEIYTLSLHDALPIWAPIRAWRARESRTPPPSRWRRSSRSEEHTSELQSPDHLVCRLLLEKKKKHDSPPFGPLLARPAVIHYNR